MPIDFSKANEEMEAGYPHIKAIEYLNWYFTQDDGIADKNAVKAWEALIREHEPKTVELIQIDRNGQWGADLIGYCPSCKRLLNSRFSNRFCGECGQAVTWND